MIIKITNYAYYNIFDNEYDKTLECPVLVITGRDSEGKFHSIKVPGNKGIYRPHFYVEDTPYNRALLSELEHQKTILEWGEWAYPSVYDENEKVLILYTKYPFEVKKLRKKFHHTYEADVRYEYMFMMKLKLDQGYLECPDREWVNPNEIKRVSEEDYFLVEPRIFYFDIETDKIDKSEKFSINNSLVISIVLYDNYLNQYDVFEWSENNGSYWKEERTVKRGIKNKAIPVTSKQIIHHCRNEKVLLRNFFECFKRRPDALFTFNGHGGYRLTSVKSNSIRIWRNGFDEPVVYIRALANDLEREIQWMSPLPRVKNVYGNYYGVYNRGKGDKFEVVIRGLTPLDFYYAAPLMQYTAKYRDFFGESLDNYLQYFAGIGKVEHEGLTVAELKEIDLETEIKYNRRDVEGCLFLDKRFGFSNDIFETVTISMVNGIDVLSATRIHKFITLYESQDYCVYDTQYQGWQRDIWKGWIKERVGGYVVPIKKGVGGWTVVIDFSQLYPSIASASNAGIDTLIEVERETDEFFIDKKGKRWNKENCIITPSAPFRTDKISIEKKIWDKLIRYRNKFKAKLAKVFAEVNGDTDHPKYKLYWAKQYNLKTRLINNKFGANGNPGFLNYCLPVYNTMPSTAQRLIKGLEKELMPKIGYELRGGDSVTADTPLLVRKDNKIFVKTIDEIDTSYEVWSDLGFTQIRNVIKHKVKKQIFRILTHCGSVDVTEDHSLLDLEGKEISPNDVNVGDNLLHNYPNVFPEISNNISEEECWVLGLFYAEGSCGKYNTKWSWKYSWAINSSNYKLLTRAKNILDKIEPHPFKILDTMKSSSVYKLVPTISIKRMVEKYRPIFYSKRKYKKVPDFILNSSYEKRKAFFDGYYEGDGDKSTRTRLDNKGKIGSAGLYYLAKSLGYGVSINTRKDKPNIFRLNLTTKSQLKPKTQIKKKHLISTEEQYVYDLETTNHHFHAGVGELIVHNTDSVFVALKSDNIEDCIEETEEIVDKVNNFIDLFVKREFNIGENRIHIGWEKIGRSFYGHKKKNYSLDVWADADFKGYILPEDKRHIMYKGFELKKGDRADITEKVQKTYLKIAHQVGEEGGDKEEFRRRIEEFIKRADKIFKYLPISQICKRATLKKKLDEYQENYYLRRAAITAGKKLNRVYGLGSNGFLAWLKNNGNSNLQSIIFFKKEDEKKMKDLDLDYDSHKQKYMINKLDLLLEDFNTSYYNILRAGKIKSAMAL